MKIETKSLLLGILFSAAVFLGFGEFEFIANANAEMDSEQCVWSYIYDARFPNIGEDGEVKLDKSWLKMSKEGWVLKAAYPELYVFEKCN